MTDSATTPTPVSASRPPFMVGITGYMDLDPQTQENLKPRLVRVFRFLRHGADYKMDPNSKSTLLDELLHDLAPASHEMRKAYRNALGKWRGLKNTPIIVLSALAPGADTLVVETALGPQVNDDPANPISIRAPLAFPLEWYRKGTSFVKAGASAEENKKRSEKLNELLEKIGDENCFAVHLADDRDKSEQQLKELYEKAYTGDAEKTARHERYYAAGEYLAVYSHLLLAIWNGEDEETGAGTAAVVKARLNGPRAGVLANTQNLAVPHGGPLLHLPAAKGGAAAPTLPAMRFLHPYVFTDGSPESGGTLIAEGQENDRPLQQRRLTTFVNVAMELDRFNELPEGKDLDDRFSDMLVGKKSLQKLLPKDESNELPPPDELRKSAAEFFGGLRLISDVRRRATDANYGLADKSKATLWHLLVITFLTTIALHFFADWEAKPKNEPNRCAEIIQLIAGGLALTAAFGGLIYFAYKRRERTDEREHDYRALAEGLRVQFYWNLAGLGTSASASYMQRQRSELDWIRGVIRGITFPYHRWTDWFNRLNPDDKKLALRYVRRGWIQEQLNYFTGRFEQYHYERHTRHNLGAAAALTAIWMFAGCWLALLSTAIGERLTHPTCQLAIGAVLLGPALLSVAAGVTVLVRRYRERQEGGEPKKELTKRRWQKALEWFLPPTDENDRSLKASILGFLGYLPFTIGLAVSIEVLCRALVHLPFAPESHNLEILFGGSLLLTAALAVAWAEKNLYSELAYQFNMMASLFRHADLRMKADLAALDPAAADFDKKLSCIQDFLDELGKEALDEHAEWLLLHRARPLEPVMPG